jgi:hypothetical protein
LQGTWLAFLGFVVTPYIFTLLAIAELIGDKLPQTPSRKAAMPFVVRIVSGAMCGAALGAPSRTSIGGLVAGVLGAVAGTLGGYELPAGQSHRWPRSPDSLSRGRHRHRRRRPDHRELLNLGLHLSSGKSSSQNSPAARPGLA